MNDTAKRIGNRDLQAVMHKLISAYERGDRFAFSSLVSDDYLIVDEGRIRNKAEAIEFLKPLESTIRVSISFEPIAAVEEPSVSIIVGKWTELVTTGDESHQADFLVTDVFALADADSAWKLASRHQSRLSPKPRPVDPDLEILVRVQGKYEFPSGMALEILTRQGKMMARVPGQPEYELSSKSKYEYFAQQFDATLLFIPDAHGEFRTLVLHQGGQFLFAHREEASL